MSSPQTLHGISSMCSWQWSWTAVVIHCNLAVFFSFQSTQTIIHNAMQTLPISVPPLALGNASLSTGAVAQTQLQLEFGLPLTEVSVATGGH